MGEIIKKVKIVGKKKVSVKALFDTGATTSFIDKKLAGKIGLVFGSKVWVELGNGSRVNGWESVARIGIKGFYVAIILIIMEKLVGKYKLVIGQDFMQREDINVDFVHDKVVVAKPFRKRKIRLMQYGS